VTFRTASADSPAGTKRPAAPNLCAGMPTGPDGENPATFRTERTYPRAGLRIDYLPASVGVRPARDPGSGLTAGRYWFYGYGWQWGNDTGHSPTVAVEVVCGAAANSLTGVKHALGGLTAGRPVTINGMKTYLAVGQDKGDAFMLVRAGLALEVQTFHVSDVNRVLHGIHVTG
jgi:hypothetical protein